MAGGTYNYNQYQTSQLPGQSTSTNPFGSSGWANTFGVPQQPQTRDQGGSGMTDPFNSMSGFTQANPTAFGGQTQTQPGQDYRDTQTMDLPPWMQGTVDALGNQIQAGAGKGVMSGDAARDQAIQAAYGQATSRLDPRFQQQESQMRTQLLNQGLDPTSEAFQTEMKNFNMGKNDAYTSAMNSAIGQGTQAGNAIFGQNVISSNLPYQQMGMVKSWAPSMGFNAATPGSGTDYLGAGQTQYNFDAMPAQQRQEMVSNFLNAAFGLGGNAVKAGTAALAG
jgi:hypothetical protein